MATISAFAHQGRVTVFSMFGPVFGYTSRLVGDKQIAYVGPLTPGVHWRKLWNIADQCCRESEKEAQKAAWIISQANRAFICGSDVVAKFSDTKWVVEEGGWKVDLGGTWCGQDVLVTGMFSVPALTAEDVAVKPTFYPHYAR
ncbi:hypothetical protein OG497_38040 [Streptomyces sp. NBC_01242]|uniref:hypothetical protein n=1 Tax=Streptomyces sp. NBC_01242 TaxID=2903795 RepID=UPI00224D4CA7|nr:hypothetical protein [Streptomyces sp. NBC_01242]MCX4799661.1 hypothetical protein [Streptomyces sp. NBC_01242]